MVIIEQDLCTKCGQCSSSCMLGAVQVSGKGKEATYSIDTQVCADCSVCTVAAMCPTEGAVVKHPDLPAGTASCYACPLGCEVRPGHMGACKRWINEEGLGLVRSVPLVLLEEVSHRFRSEDVSGPGSGTGP